MAEPFWAAAGPSRPTPSSFAAIPVPTNTKKKRGRFSGDNSQNAASSIPSIVNPPSPELVPRHSSSASSWGIEDLSDSDGDYDWPTPTLSSTSAAAASMLPNTNSNLDRDELARFARTSKRVRLETPEDQHTYGQLAGLRIDPSAQAASAPNEAFFASSCNSRSNSGVAGAFGLSTSLASTLGTNVDGFAHAPRVPPSSPTKSDAISSSFGSLADRTYQQAVAPVPPTSPNAIERFTAPPSSPLHSYHFDSTAMSTVRATSADLEDSDMRQRRGDPSSYEVEPDRIIVTSLDDTSSSEGDASSETEGQKTPDADTSTESKDSSNDFVINNELMAKLEAHSRAVLTGTSDRDNAASASRSGGGSNPTSRSRRSGRRSGGTAVSSLGSLLNSRRRSAQSSPGSSGYASPINAEEVRGALILWKDPEEVLKTTSTSSSSSSTLKPSGLASVPENGATATSFMNQSPVAFQSGSSLSQRLDTGPSPLGENQSASFSTPGMASVRSSWHASESPLYAQQSSLSSSYFPEASPLETRSAKHASQQIPEAFGSAAAHESTKPRPHHDTTAFVQARHAPGSTTNDVINHTHGHPFQQQLAPHHYGHHYSTYSHDFSAAFQSHAQAAQPSSHRVHTAGAQPIDLSGCFGPAEEMDLDN
ncbi:uncharacterized protein UMAG_05237 [Mycosarcoma maydis]|uniref:Uncharacterized protein n=1 Tax=Mycosarcoma maydis TaxID=5270 RepID=A0A0D1CUR1_MYCMD|nr:uncharacterized protein UMAG_05237 [Ustilago maydis 521]KIS70168.1 hypothetical protein UMAG_05237 [Ustilago maydis 521]|eukprot:XP_011388271.1 hypothetical protein UMAG_05237 [Ustilago maydis 521]